jgi:GNAT superfamily N-acetyltransferase
MSGAHPLGPVLDAAAHGRFPEPDGGFDVYPSLPGLADAMIGFTGHFVLAGDVDRDAIASRVPHGELSVPMSAPFLTWVGEQLGSQPLTFDALLSAFGTGAGPPHWLQRLADGDHPRVERARRYRSDIEVWRTDDGNGIVALGLGVCGRREIGFEVASAARGAGLGRRLASAARDLAPAGTPLWAQVAPGNAASLRAVLAAGFVPIAAEVLFPHAG